MPNYAQPADQSKNKLTRPIVLGLILIAGILAITNVILSASLSHVGLKLQDMHQRAQILEIEIHKLEQQINARSSLISIKSKAGDFGFVTEYQAIALPKSSSVAYHSQ